MNHECINDLSIKISIEFQRSSQSFPFKRIFRKLNFDPGSGVTSKIQTYLFNVPSPCNRRTGVGIESIQYLPYQSM